MDSLIQGRGKRATAGRHMSALLDAEADDDLALLFEEVDDDNEFSEAEDDGDDDMRMDSSSEDDEDRGPNAKENEDEGEQELQKEVRAERKKRRAQDDLRLKALRKKVKIDPTAVSAPPPRPKKKSERISWLPTPEEGPTRSSSRRQTMQNKELTHARLKDSEEKRVRLIATMEEAAKRKAHLKPKERTQAEWLAEAARVERLNSKSLNRWEETEKRKADERRTKIEALQNRRLEGPVMSYWSGIATWVDGRLSRVGKVDIKSKPKPEKEEPARKRTKKEKEEKPVDQKPELSAAGPSQTIPGAPVLPGPPAPEPATPVAGQERPIEDRETNQVEVKSGQSSKPIEAGTPTSGPEDTRVSAPDSSIPIHTKTPTSVDNAPAVADTPSRVAGESTETGIPNQTDSIPPEALSRRNSNIAVVIRTPKAAPATLEDGERRQQAPDMPPQKPEEESSTPTVEKRDSAALDPAASSAQPAPGPAGGPLGPTVTQPGDASLTQQQHTSTPSHPVQGPHDHPVPANHDAVMAPPRAPVIERTGRNLIILEDFDDKTAQSRDYSIYFNAKKPARLSSMWNPCDAPQDG